MRIDELLSGGAVATVAPADGPADVGGLLRVQTAGGKRGKPFPAPGGVLRLVREGPAAPAGAPCRGPSDVAAILGPICLTLTAEVFGIIALDAQHRMIGGAPVEITRGLVNSSLVAPRETFRAAIVTGATAVILWHNHPSGDPTPSNEDRAVTSQLVAAGRLLDLPVHDHIVMGNGRYVSFAEAGLL